MPPQNEVAPGASDTSTIRTSESKSENMTLTNLSDGTRLAQAIPGFVAETAVDVVPMGIDYNHQAMLQGQVSGAAGSTNFLSSGATDSTAQSPYSVFNPGTGQQFALDTSNLSQYNPRTHSTSPINPALWNSPNHSLPPFLYDATNQVYLAYVGQGQYLPFQSATAMQHYMQQATQGEMAQSGHSQMLQSNCSGGSSGRSSRGGFFQRLFGGGCGGGGGGGCSSGQQQGYDTDGDGLPDTYAGNGGGNQYYGNGFGGGGGYGGYGNGFGGGSGYGGYGNGFGGGSGYGGYGNGFGGGSGYGGYGNGFGGGGGYGNGFGGGGGMGGMNPMMLMAMMNMMSGRGGGMGGAMNPMMMMAMMNGMGGGMNGMSPYGGMGGGGGGMGGMGMGGMGMGGMNPMYMAMMLPMMIASMSSMFGAGSGAGTASESTAATGKKTTTGSLTGPNGKTVSGTKTTSGMGSINRMISGAAHHVGRRR